MNLNLLCNANVTINYLYYEISFYVNSYNEIWDLEPIKFKKPIKNVELEKLKVDILFNNHLKNGISLKQFFNDYKLSYHNIKNIESFKELNKKDLISN